MTSQQPMYGDGGKMVGWLSPDIDKKEQQKILTQSLQNILERVKGGGAAFYVAKLYMELVRRNGLNDEGLHHLQGFLERMGETCG